MIFQIFPELPPLEQWWFFPPKADQYRAGTRTKQERVSEIQDKDGFRVGRYRNDEGDSYPPFP